MINAKAEFLEEVGEKEVLCAKILFEDYWHDRVDGYKESQETFFLKYDYTESELLHFLNELDFDYYDGHGTQHIFGFIWYKDGTWSERGEYDGSEWWEHRKVPEIPKCLK